MKGAVRGDLFNVCYLIFDIFHFSIFHLSFSFVICHLLRFGSLTFAIESDIRVLSFACCHSRAVIREMSVRLLSDKIDG